MSDLLDKAELATALKKCPEWEHEKDSITRTVEFEEFMDAIDFVNDLAEIVDEAQHYPDITVRHTRVTIRLPRPPAPEASTAAEGTPPQA